MTTGGVDRRTFLGASGTAAAASLLGVRPGAAAPTAKARAVLVRRAEALGADGRVNGPVLHEMLNEAVCTLLGEKDPGAAWRRIVKPGDVVGVKSNVWAALPTPPELEEAIKRRVLEAGVPPEDVGIDDRGVLRNPLFQKTTALINVRPLRTHHWSGVGTCLKNYIMFVPDPSSYHG